MAQDIYAQHDAAFAKVSAYVVMKDGERVATIAFKFPADGAGRLYAYVHVIGLEMTRGYAGGYGYDKRTAAVVTAFSKIAPRDNPRDNYRQDMLRALAADGGQYWDRLLADAGYNVLQAV